MSTGKGVNENFKTKLPTTKGKFFKFFLTHHSALFLQYELNNFDITKTIVMDKKYVNSSLNLANMWNTRSVARHSL